MQFSVIGNANQCVLAQMTVGDEVCADAANLIVLSDGITIEQSSNTAAELAMRTPVLDAPVALTHFRCSSGVGVATFAAPYSGQSRQLEVHGGTWMCARDSFLFCTSGVKATIGMAHSVAGGYFRDSGYVVYRLAGHGDAFIHCGGDTIEYNLEPGQRVTVDAGCVAAYQDTVQAAAESLDVMTSGSGASVSLFLITLTGPGKIYLASLPLSRIGQR